jgi:hypothetical protein
MQEPVGVILEEQVCSLEEQVCRWKTPLLAHSLLESPSAWAFEHSMVRCFILTATDCVGGQRLHATTRHVCLGCYCIACQLPCENANFGWYHCQMSFQYALWPSGFILVAWRPSWRSCSSKAR